MKPMNVRTKSECLAAEKLLHGGNITFVLIYADWCGHCHNYLPQWEEFENLPGRNANIMKVHYDMMENIPLIQHAKIQGYPSVIKVNKNGSMEQYNVEQSSEKTNALPHMRNKEVMTRELTNNVNDKTVSNILPSALKRMKGAGRKRRTFKSPKRANRRGSTRKNR